MKTTMITKAMLAVVFALASVCMVNAAEPVKVTNIEMDNGRIVARVVYEKNGNFLTPEFRFEFKYNDEGQVVERKSQKWDGTKWINYYCMAVTYTNTEAHIDYSLWNKGQNEFILTQRYAYTLDEAGRFLSLRSYKRTMAGWELDSKVTNGMLLANR